MSTVFFTKAARNLILAAAFAFPTFTWAKTSAKPTLHHVTIENIKFNPNVLTVKKGDTVIWMNNDIVPHTVTAATKGAKPEFDSGQIDPGKSYTLTVKKAGQFSYKCLYHPMMKATLNVE